MRKLLLITFALISNYSFSQLRSVVIDKETKEAIPYVNIWIEDENIGTTSNQQGEFEINIDNNAYSLWRVNGCQQGFRSVASFGFGGQESASKPPQAICKPLCVS
jgi:hypothetical protein